MPIQDGPFIMKDTLEDPNYLIDQPMPVGVVREFTVRLILCHTICIPFWDPDKAACCPCQCMYEWKSSCAPT